MAEINFEHGYSYKSEELGLRVLQAYEVQPRLVRGWSLTKVVDYTEFGELIIDTSRKYISSLGKQPNEFPYCPELQEYWIDILKNPASAKEKTRIERVNIFGLNTGESSTDAEYTYYDYNLVVFKTPGIQSGVCYVDGTFYLTTPMIIGITPEGKFIVDFLRFTRQPDLRPPGITFVGKELYFTPNEQTILQELLKQTTL